MAERLLTARNITNEALRVLVNNLTFDNLIERGEGAAIVVDEDPDARLTYRPGKIGDTIRLRKPPRYTSRRYDPGSLVEPSSYVLA